MRQAPSNHEDGRVNIESKLLRVNRIILLQRVQAAAAIYSEMELEGDWQQPITFWLVLIHFINKCIYCFYAMGASISNQSRALTTTVDAEKGTSTMATGDNGSSYPQNAYPYLSCNYAKE